MQKAALVLGAGAMGAAASSDYGRQQIRSIISNPEGAVGGVSNEVANLGKRLEEIQRSLANPPPTVIVSGGGGGGTSLSTILLVGTGVTGVAATYMWWKGWGIESLFYVTQAGLEQATAALSSKIADLNAALAEASASLNALLGTTKDELQSDIGNMRESLEGEVGATRMDVRGVREQVGVVQTTIDGVRTQVGSALGQIEHTNRGMWLLLNAVSESVPAQSPAMVQLRSYVQQQGDALPGAPLQRAISAPPEMGGTGVSVEAVDGEGEQRDGLDSSLNSTARSSSSRNSQTLTGLLGL